MSKQENKKPVQEPEPTKVDLEEGELSEEELETINGGLQARPQVHPNPPDVFGAGAPLPRKDPDNPFS